MDKLVKKISVKFAIVIFFIMAVASLACDLPLTTACGRAVTGAIISYVIGTFALKGIFTVIIDAIAKSKSQES